MKEARLEINASERIEIFQEQFGDDLDAGNTLADLVIATGNYLARIVGEATADAGMARIVEGVVVTSGNSIAKPSDWRDALNEARSNCYSEWPLGQRLHGLTAYAIYGVVINDCDSEAERAQEIEALVKEAEDFLAVTPLGQWRIDADRESELSRLIRLARNRWALDNNELVEPAALAAFGGVSEGRIRNLMSDGTFKSEDGRIPAHQALGWLTQRKEFWNSVWREQSVSRFGHRERPPLDEPVFVPVARDGSFFHPLLKRGAGYTIGEKGAETQIATFDAAIRELQQMPIPYWRRPNSAGHWGIVAGIRWERIDLTDLEALASDPHARLSQ